MTINISADKIMRQLQFVVLLAILGLLLWSKPWDTTASTASEQRTITVNGEAVIEAVPDEFVFYPYLEKTGTDRDALRSELTQQANVVVDQIKALGVDENSIRLDASAYDRWYWEENEEGTMTVSLTVTLDSKETAQQVQDYLLTLDNLRGQLTPQASFSESKQKELETQAVEAASKDARARAEAQAVLFDAKLGDVVTVEQGNDFGYPVFALDSAVGEEISAKTSLPVLPGEDEYRQTVIVTYELK